jgi:hypothetical protein
MMNCSLYLSVLMIIGVVFSCKNHPDSELSASDIQKMINNPVTATSDADKFITTISVEPKIFDAGQVMEGAVINHTFYINNTGKVPLEKSEIKSTCGCTVAESGTSKIPPGGRDSITVRFDTKGFTGVQEKKITLIANIRPREHYFTIRADVSSSDR